MSFPINNDCLYPISGLPTSPFNIDSTIIMRAAWAANAETKTSGVINESNKRKHSSFHNVNEKVQDTVSTSAYKVLNKKSRGEVENNPEVKAVVCALPPVDRLTHSVEVASRADTTRETKTVACALPSVGQLTRPVLAESRVNIAMVNNREYRKLSDEELTRNSVEDIDAAIREAGSDEISFYRNFFNELARFTRDPEVNRLVDEKLSTINTQVNWPAAQQYVEFQKKLDLMNYNVRRRFEDSLGKDKDKPKQADRLVVDFEKMCHHQKEVLRLTCRDYQESCYLEPAYTIQLPGETARSKEKVVEIFSRRLDPKNNTYVSYSQGERGAMEDFYLAENFHFIGAKGERIDAKVSAVFDGHNGDGCAKYAKSWLISHLTAQLQEHYRLSPEKPNIEQACSDAIVNLSRSFTQITYKCLDKLKKEICLLSQRPSTADTRYELKSLYTAGSTANVVLILNKITYVINTGDSRAIFVGRNGRVMQLSKDHKPEDPEIKKEVEDCGGWLEQSDVLRIEGDLAVGRALGGHHMASLSARPTITKFSLCDGFVLQCTDGLTDRLNTSQIGKFSHDHLYQRRSPLQLIPAALVDMACKLRSSDNVTVLMTKIGH